MDASESQAIVNWINTFELEQPCSIVTELSNGLTLIKICNEIAPDSFETESLNHEVSGNWIIASSNLKKLLRLLDEFYSTVLFKTVNLADINPDAIVRQNDMDQLVSLMEVVIGAAVMCEQKAQFIARIFALDHDSQTVLKGMIERVMTRVTNVEVDGAVDGFGYSESTAAGGDDGNAADISEDLLRSQELVRHLQDERQRLLKEVSAMDQNHNKLKTELDSVKLSYQALQTQMSEVTNRHHEGHDITTNRQASAMHSTLQNENDELKRELDLQMVEIANMKSQLKVANQRYEASKEIQAKLEAEAQHMADELDVSRDKAQRLAKAEATIDKYQKKLEEMVVLKKQNKELSDKMDSYLDKIQELESNNKNMTTLNRLVDQYRDKAVELEREKFEAISTVELNTHELQRLKNELETSHDAKRFLEDEVETLRAEVQSLTEAATIGSPGVSGSGRGSGFGGDAFEVESISSLREKVHRLERELKVYKSSSEVSSESVLVSVSGGAAGGESDKGFALLQAELEDLKLMKKEREDALIASKKQVSELNAEVHKLQRIVTDLEQSNATNQAASLAMKEMENKSSISASTMKHLEDILKEKESVINRLEQEKGKLESYARRTLSSFKEKYMQTLQMLKDEKRALEERVKYLSARHDRNMETSRREEKLLSSAIYEIGVRLMDRKIQEQVLEPSGGLGSNYTFLGSQRKMQNSVLSGDGSGGNTSLQQPPKAGFTSKFT